MRPFVILSALFLAVCLAYATRDLNFVASDEERLYLPATRELPFINYPSELCHSFNFDNPRLVHGKEVTIWLFSLTQRLLRDFNGLRPLLWTVIAAWAVSAVLVFEVAAFYWGRRAGLYCYGFFVTSFWPLLYVLLVKHQPSGLMLFLLAVFALQRSGTGRVSRRLWPLTSGAAMAAGLHASTVSPLYLPFYAAAIFKRARALPEGLRIVDYPGAYGLLGFCAVVYYLNYPHVLGNIGEFLGYVDSSRWSNHFSFHQNVLRGWMADPARAYGGWEWIFKYLWLAMPIIFPLYFWAVWKCRRAWPLVLLSFSPAVLAFLSHVAQYGGNYFPCFIGALVLIGYACRPTAVAGGLWKRALPCVFALHLCVNAFVFLTDIFPGRMASAYLSRELHKRQITEIHVHKDNPVNPYLIGKIDPEFLKTLRIKRIENIHQAGQGPIVLAPVVGSSIYLAMVQRFADYDYDIYLNELLRKNALRNYALASFKTMATSRVWRQEEEMLSYRDLILGQFAGQDIDKTKLWLLDGRRLYKDRPQNLPAAEYGALVVNGIRNIGTKSGLYRYKGLMLAFDRPARVAHVKMRLFKTGAPADGLIMYIYQRGLLGRGAPLLAWRGGWASLPVPSNAMTADHAGQVREFVFEPPLDLPAGQYHFVIYRTGPDSDHDFYRTYIDETERTDYTSRIPYPLGL